MSRIILESLGIDDYGIYQVVGGLVMMFSIISSSFSASIARFITYEIGKGSIDRIKTIFSTSLRIQLVLACIIFVIGETVGLWFIGHKMEIPIEKITAAKWVLQFSLLTFCVNLISVPFNACLIAHEQMKAFAYISVIDVLLKLGVTFLLFAFSAYRLVIYAASLLFISIAIRFIYLYYCKNHFEECRDAHGCELGLFKEMLSFSGWSFFTNLASILNTQGVTMLINVFFGLAVNTARGLATQVESALMQFVGNFTMSINPQITKSYAAGEYAAMHTLVCRGSKFSYYAMLILGLPLLFITEPVLKLWLGTVPQYTMELTRLSIIMGMIDCIGTSGFTACMATGKLRKYALIIAPIGYIELPGTWILFKLGASVESSYYLFIGVKSAVIIVRMFLLRSMVMLPVKMYLNRTLLPIILTSISAFILSYIVYINLNISYVSNSIIMAMAAIVSVIACSWFVGITKGERNVIKEKVATRLHIRL